MTQPKEENKFHVVLDLETLGTTPGCGILAIGATSLDLKDRFYMKVRPHSNKRYRLLTEASTLAWWSTQSEEARNESFSGTTDLRLVLEKFTDWFLELNNGDVGTTLVWGNGADFDLPILKVAYKEVNIPWPVAPFNGRCLRTLRSLKPEIKKPPFVGEKHTAIADARNQAEHLALLLA